ncbi:MAG: ABC transporter substrate-binding protein [Rhodocyclaceae bacterium]|jgi:phosphonate transport system substrate-binding protein|nr:ABC transporter substrate-binding protein [Rhodocyclaceae bacterium]
MDHARRTLIAALAAGTLLGVTGASQGRGREMPPVRIGLTPVFLNDQMGFLLAWKEYLEAKLQRPVEFVQRQTYKEITDLLLGGRLDFAWICGYPYVRNRAKLRLVAVPVFNGKPLYQSYLIVPADDRNTMSLDALRGKVFAFSDPDSNSGHLYIQYLLRKMGETPATFFSRTFFTSSHRKVVESVAAGVAHGGAVDGYVWETLLGLQPDLTNATRVAARSPYFGHTPFVARHDIPASEFAAMQAVLIQMEDGVQGQSLLRRLNLDGFIPGEPKLFDGIAQMMRAVHGG